jgi:hypothetical protein
MCGSCREDILKATRLTQTDTRVEAGSSTSTVTLRVVGDDENGSLKSETVKYKRESQGTRPGERLHWQEPAAYTKDPFYSQIGRPIETIR